MTESVYDGAQTAADILYGYRSYLRAEIVNLANEEIEDLIKKFEKCADNSHGPRRHDEIRGLIVGITNVDVISENDVPKED